MAFLEERLPICFRLGASAEDSYFNKEVKVAGGGRYAWLMNPLPYRVFDVGYIKPRSETAVALKGAFDRTFGGFAGLRVKSWDDFTTASDGFSPYTALDCTMDKVSTGIYQLVKEYGREKPGLVDIGRPRRPIFKPVAGKVLVGVGGQSLPAAQWSVDTVTGKVTLAANKSKTITGITKASSAVIEVGSNTFVVGDSVVITGVFGMTQINNRRALVTSKPDGTHITVGINTAAFSDWTSGGIVQTLPASSEAVTCGCEFDIPCAFASTFSIVALEGGYREVGGQRLEEILDPFV